MKKINNRKGSSMVIALVTMMIVTLACLTLFTTMSAATNNAGRDKDSEQARIIAASVSKILQDQIENGVTEPAEDAEESTGLIAGNDLAGYLLDNLGKEGWGWYNEKERGHNDKAAASRSFDLESPVELAKSKSQCSVKLTMYWTSDEGSEEISDSEARNLYVTVTAKVKGMSGSHTCSLTSRFYCTHRDNGLYWWTYSGEMK